MESEENHAIEAAEDLKVPDDLLQKLHQANQNFHQVKQQMETVTGDAEYSHQQRLDQLQEKLRTAEREVEQVTMEIHGTLKPPPDQSSH